MRSAGFCHSAILIPLKSQYFQLYDSSYKRMDVLDRRHEKTLQEIQTLKSKGMLFFNITITKSNKNSCYPSLSLLTWQQMSMQRCSRNVAAIQQPGWTKRTITYYFGVSQSPFDYQKMEMTFCFLELMKYLGPHFFGRAVLNFQC